MVGVWRGELTVTGVTLAEFRLRFTTHRVHSPVLAIGLFPSGLLNCSEPFETVLVIVLLL